MNWLEAAAKLTRENAGFVLVTVVATQGSAPRDAAAKMVVTAAQTHDSIGGGRLEFDATGLAREMLAAGRPRCKPANSPSAPTSPSAAAGASELLLECFPACAFNIGAWFGAGHVGRALATILAELPCRVRWFDARADALAPARPPTSTPSS